MNNLNLIWEKAMRNKVLKITLTHSKRSKARTDIKVFKTQMFQLRQDKEQTLKIEGTRKFKAWYLRSGNCQKLTVQTF